MMTRTRWPRLDAATPLRLPCLLASFAVFAVAGCAVPTVPQATLAPTEAPQSVHPWCAAQRPAEDLGLGLEADDAPDASHDEDAPEVLYQKIGTASWYGPRHQGKRTASGERFDMHKLTAAHRTLPLDTTARITNLENGRSVKVTINDRGPYVPGRIIDLSAKAAQQLGMRRDGLARVRVEVLAADQPAAGADESAALSGE